MKKNNYDFHIISYHWYNISFHKSHREFIFNYYKPWFEKVVKKFISLYKYPLVDFNDYINFGYIGFLQSIDRFDTSRGTKFETYAEPYIRGSIFKGLLPYIQDFSIINDHSFYHNSLSDIDQQFDQIIDAVVGLAFGRFLELGIIENPIIIDDNYADATDLFDHLNQIVESLCDVEKIVIKSYYFNNISFKEISNHLNLSKSRISQIHTNALVNIRNKFHNWTTCNLEINQLNF